ncbi:MAG: transporter substrate-binding domain-containing protein, partial [Nitrospinaceae bacterium]|nr:transporter substrate-binding domain-containing protein [Nitrospinaceae bacterium]
GHPVVRIGVDASYAPYSFRDDSGRYHGVVMEFIKALEQRLGIRMEVVPRLTWPEILQGARERTLDMIATAVKRPKREAYLNFTKIYLPTPLAIMTRKEDSRILKPGDLAGKTVALVEGYSSSKRVIEEQPGARILSVKTALDGLRAVSTRQADAYVGIIGINTYLSQKNGILNLKVAAFYDSGTTGQRIAVRKDWPEFKGILDKALASIPENERLELMGKWISLTSLPSQKRVQLTTEEQAWLRDHKTIRVGMDSAFAPVEFKDEDGNSRGLARDFLDILSKRLGVEFQPAGGKIWAQIVEKVKNREIDMFSAVVRTPSREKYVNFTKPYMKLPIMIFARNEHPYIAGLDELAGKTIAVVKGFAIVEFLKRDHPGFKLIEIATVEEALRALATGKVDTYIDFLFTTSYKIQKLGYANIKVAGETHYNFQLSMAPRSDWPILVTILDKGLKSISEEERNAVFRKWRSFSYNLGFDYSLIWKIFIPLAFLLVLVVFWNRRLRRDLDGRLHAERDLRERTAHLEFSGEISKAITQNIEPDKLFRAIADRIKEEIPCDRFIISRVDAESGASKYFYEDSKEAFGPPSPEERKLANFAAEMFEKKAPVSIPDLLETQWRIHRIARAGYRSLLLVPVYLEDTYIAHFNLGSKLPEAFSGEKVNLLNAIAGHLGPAIQNSELYKESESRRENLEVVGKIAQAISASLEPEKVFRRIADEVGKLIPSDRFSISSIDESLVRHSWYEVDNLNLREYSASQNTHVAEQIRGEVYLKQKSILNENTENIPARLIEAGIKSRLISPVIQDGKVIAHISLSRRHENFFSVEDQELLLEIAPHLGPAITNARLFEEAQKNRDFFQSVMDDNADAMIVTDSNQKIIQWNDAAEAMYGYTKQEILGQTFTVMLTEEAENDRRFGMEMRNTGRPVHFDSFRRRKNGSKFPVNLALSPIKDRNGEIVATCSIHKDLTESRRAEAELRKAQKAAMESARLKSEFLANMSHEIRTPMNGVLGMTGLLLDTDLTEQQRRYGNTILYSSESLLTLLNDILDFSKIEAGQLMIEPVNFDLLQTVESVMDVFSSRAYEKNIELITRFPPGIPHRFVGDQGRVRQILNNLIGNAVKFTEKGHVLLEIEKIEPLTEHFSLRISVQDTGVGIEASKLDHIFDKFTQADTSTTREYGGTGLGLSISKQLSEMMGGGIGVSSRLGEGSKFWVDLSFPIDTQAPAEAGQRSNLSDVRVLIVDDNEIGRQVIHEQIMSIKMRNGNYASGESALRALREAQESGDPFQIAILDQRMPGMDGLTLARHIKSDPGIRETVLVILSSEDIPLHEMADMEVAAYLKKPVRPSELHDTLVKAWGAPSPKNETDSITSGGKIETRFGRDTLSRQRAPSIISARLLVVEDNQVNQMVAKEILEKYGCRVDIAGDGKEALEQMKILPYDAVLMDCLMPVMDGYEATRQIRRKEQSKGDHIPIIAMTANAMKGDREKCLEAGMDDYVSKPVNPDKLLKALLRWVEKKSVPPADPGPPSALSAPSDEILDLEHLSAMAKLGEASGEDILKKLIDKFFSDTPQRLSSLKEVLAGGDAQALEQQAHSLKGSSANLGARRMAEVCERLEQSAHENRIEGAEELLAEVTQEYQHAKEALASKPWMES